MKKICKYFVVVALALSFFRLSAEWVSRETPLMRVSYKGDLVTMEKLIAEGTNVNATAGCDQPHTGTTVLQCAIEGGSIEAVRMLINAGANIDAFTSNCPFLIFERPDNKANVRNLPLLSAAINASVSIDIIQLLIDAKADVNKKGLWSDLTPLMVAAYQGCGLAVQALLDAGADKTLKNHQDDGRLAIDYAREKGYTHIVRMLES